MKNTLLLSFILFFSSCELLDQKKPKTELEKLPPLTTTGENTFGCLVNGKALVPKRSTKSGAIFQNNELFIGADFDNPNRSISIIVFDGSSVAIGNVFDLTDTLKSYSRYFVRDQRLCDYDTHSTIVGSLKIGLLDSENRIISGEFDFTKILGECDTLRVTNGRFDLQYIP
ncbi:MAG: hypothetical protein ABJG41_02385 [Cyclobacteriaceae bacterium]